MMEETLVPKEKRFQKLGPGQDLKLGCNTDECGGFIAVLPGSLTALRMTIIGLEPIQRLDLTMFNTSLKGTLGMV